MKYVRAKFLAGGLCALAALFHASSALSIDLRTGNAPLEVVIPTVAPVVFTDVSPSGGDATLVLRITTLVTNAWFDASAPYHPTAQGIYSRLGRRPAAEATNHNINVAALHATYHVLNSLLPKRASTWRDMLTSVGLDPDNTSENTATPVGIGNLAGKAVVRARERDGMNQLGDAGDSRVPYADYTGYEPVNTAYKLRDPSRWQPNIISLGNGLFSVQQFVTPQYARTHPYSYNNPNRFRAPQPVASDPRRSPWAYRAQADEVLQASANLTDRQKMVAELFNNKILSLGFSAVFAAQSRQLSLLIHLDFVTNLAAFDTGIAIWNQKVRWDAVRPFSAIRYLYGDRAITAWGGPGRGTVHDITGNQWRSYLNVADHAEYPSGSSAFCGAHAQAARRFLGSDSLNWDVPVPKGSSVIEPGITPASDIVLSWATWSDFEADCGLSRLWAGVHFRPAIEEGNPIGRTIGDIAYQFFKRHVEGHAPPLRTLPHGKTAS